MPVWLARYVAEVLRFVEFERRVLPFKLIESNSERTCYHHSRSPHTFNSRDGNAPCPCWLRGNDLFVP